MFKSLRKVSVETLISFSVLVALSVFLIGGAGIPLFINNALAQVSTTTSQTINLTVNQTITLTLSTSTVSLGSLTPGSAVSATSSATVATNSANGWNLKVNRNSATSTLASSTITFPDATAWNGSNGTTSPGATLAFKVANTGTDAALYSSTNWGASDTDGVAKYAGFPTSATNVVSTSSYIGTSQVVMLKIRADAPATQQATSYTGTVTITAITNP
ncbi:MAG: hypothetical protein ABSE68_02070 [Minisyncoccia bacterium]